MNNIKKTKLANGLPLLIAPVKGTKTATVLVMFKTGSKYETRKNNGISHFLEHMFFKGTFKRPTTLALSSELDALGGEFNAFTSKEYTGYYVKADARKIPAAMEILSDMLLHSKFDEEEIEREKGVIVEEIKMYEDNPSMSIEDVFESCLYGDTPAGWDTAGKRENVRRFQKKDFMDYLKTQYGARSGFICLAGAISFAEGKLLAAKFFKDYGQNKFKNKIKVSVHQTKPALKVKQKKIDQVNLSLGVHAYPANHPDTLIVKLISIILGGSMSSRLFIELRERRGLAYTVRTTTETYTDSGYLTTRAGVPKEKLMEAIRVILEEYRKIKNYLVDTKELKRAKDMIRGRLVIQLEGSDDVANWYAHQAILKEKILTPEEFLKKIEKISAADIRRVARKIFVNRGLNFAAIGEVKGEQKIKGILKI